MAKATRTARIVPLDQARRQWRARQGLPGAMRGSPGEVVSRTGWVRTLGGVEVYVGLWARAPGLRREVADAAASAWDLQVIPAVRGCIYAVPRAHVPLCLAVAADQALPRMRKELDKVGLDEAELCAVEAATLETLAAGPETTDGLRRRLPAGLLRPLGEVGKKLGISSALPSALRRLEFAGKVGRRLVGGRYDTERYTWEIHATPPSGDVPAQPAGRAQALARLFFGWAAPASLTDFAEWAGLGVTAAKAAVGAIGLEPVAVPGYSDEAWGIPDAHADSQGEDWSFLPFEDNLLTLHGGPAPLTDPRHHGLGVPVWGQTRGGSVGDVRHVHGRTLIHGDQMVGLWEMDMARGQIVASLFDPPSAAARASFEATAAPLAALFRGSLGHARSFSLDSDESVAERAAALSTLGTVLRAG